MWKKVTLLSKKYVDDHREKKDLLQKTNNKGIIWCNQILTDKISVYCSQLIKKKQQIFFTDKISVYRNLSRYESFSFVYCHQPQKEKQYISSADESIVYRIWVWTKKEFTTILNWFTWFNFCATLYNGFVLYDVIFVGLEYAAPFRRGGGEV